METKQVKGKTKAKGKFRELRDQGLRVLVTASQKQRLRERAAKEGVTVSTLTAMLIERGLRDD